MFREAVHEVVTNSLKTLTHPVQGYIPEDGINFGDNICTVRIPSPHGGIHPGDSGNPNYIELKAVPLPFYVGVLVAWDHLLKRGSRAVLVGFKGANMAFPYIICPLSVLPGQDHLDKSVEARKPVEKDRALSQAGAQLITPQPPPDEQLPSIKSFDELVAPEITPPPVTASADASAPFLAASNTDITAQLDNALLRDLTPTPVTPFQ